MHAGAALALVGDHQAEDLGVETLHPVPVLHVDAHVGEARADIGHWGSLLGESVLQGGDFRKRAGRRCVGSERRWGWLVWRVGAQGSSVGAVTASLGSR